MSLCLPLSVCRLRQVKFPLKHEGIQVFHFHEFKVVIAQKVSYYSFIDACEAHSTLVYSRK